MSVWAAGALLHVAGMCAFAHACRPSPATGPSLAGAKSVQHIGAPFLIAGGCIQRSCWQPAVVLGFVCLPPFVCSGACRLLQLAICAPAALAPSQPTAAFDDAMLDKCAAAGLPCLPARFASDANFRQDFAAFRAMGAVKVRCPAPEAYTACSQSALDLQDAHAARAACCCCCPCMPFGLRHKM